MATITSTGRGRQTRVSGKTRKKAATGGWNLLALAIFFVIGFPVYSMLNSAVKQPLEWQAGKGFFGGTIRNAPGEKPQKILRAIDVQTGRVAWEVPQIGSAESWGGVLATAGGLVFFCDDGGAFAAVDAKTGKRLWGFPVNDLWKASPMTYSFDGKQYVAVAAGSNVLAFGLK